MISDAWEKKRLIDFCTIEIGGTPARNNPAYWADGESPNLWVSIRDLDKRIINDTAEKITDAGIRHSNAKLVEAGSVLMSFKLTIGKVAFAGKNLYTNEAIVALTSNDVDLKFLYYGLQQWDLLADVDQAIKGATLNKQKIRNIEAFLPVSRIEQRKIAEVLTAVDHTITQTEALIAKYQRIKTGLMQDLLTRGIDENGNLRDPATHAFKDSEIGRIPTEWEVKLLKEIAQVSSGVTLGRHLEGQNVVELPYLRVANVQDGYLDLAEVKTVKVYEHEVERYLLQAGDVLMNEGGDYDKLGRGAVWYGQINPCLHQNHVFRVRSAKSSLLPEYLALVSESPYGKRFFILNSKQSTNLASINSTQLKSFPIPSPSLEEQTRIIEALSACDNQIKKELSQRQKLQRVKTGLMQDLLTGKVSITPLLDSDREGAAS